MSGQLLHHLRYKFCVPSIILIISMTNKKKKLGERDRHIKERERKKKRTNSVN